MRVNLRNESRHTALLAEVPPNDFLKLRSSSNEARGAVLLALQIGATGNTLPAYGRSCIRSVGWGAAACVQGGEILWLSDNNCRMASRGN